VLKCLSTLLRIALVVCGFDLICFIFTSGTENAGYMQVAGSRAESIIKDKINMTRSSGQSVTPYRMVVFTGQSMARTKRAFSQSGKPCASLTNDASGRANVCADES
jgi:hypothetical protein